MTSLLKCRLHRYISPLPYLKALKRHKPSNNDVGLWLCSCLCHLVFKSSIILQQEQSVVALSLYFACLTFGLSTLVLEWRTMLSNLVLERNIRLGGLVPEWRIRFCCLVGRCTWIEIYKNRAWFAAMGEYKAMLSQSQGGPLAQPPVTPSNVFGVLPIKLSSLAQRSLILSWRLLRSGHSSLCLYQSLNFRLRKTLCCTCLPLSFCWTDDWVGRGIRLGGWAWALRNRSIYTRSSISSLDWSVAFFKKASRFGPQKELVPCALSRLAIVGLFQGPTDKGIHRPNHNWTGWLIVD